MTLTKTPICEFGKKADFFELESVENKLINLNTARGENGILIIFICNHCPYVVASIEEIVETSKILKEYKINTLAIMPNDTEKYTEDSFENMGLFAKKYKIDFPYVNDKYQIITKNYGAVCTPDFFGYNSNLELQYRGRLREYNKLKAKENSKNELLLSMIDISKTKKGPKTQMPSMGCSIKWF